MKGAKEYARLFRTGQYGKLYLTVGGHARGDTFHIQVLPKDEKAIPNGNMNLCTNVNAVEVYGITGGNPGWTEEYGWLHEGKWQQDFNELVKKVRAKNATEEKARAEEITKEETDNKDRTQRLLANY